MLKMIDSFRQLDFSQLAAVYEESIQRDASEQYKLFSINEGYLQARQAFHDFLKYDFFPVASDKYALWVHLGRYVAALRLEPYKDGFLIAGLETAPKARRKGYAETLLRAVIDYLQQTENVILYSHIDKRNFASLKIHSKCGFERVSEYAVFVDGSVSHSSCTMRLNN